MKSRMKRWPIVMLVVLNLVGIVTMILDKQITRQPLVGIICVNLAFFSLMKLDARERRKKTKGKKAEC